ncbi:hypothetical protein K438DRAFT_1790355 [Mycena galopus ATCC 62051]|nr:hypothetical protein K438DRAFT_1790355 [Mycena galopus ATCC 62051]
MPLEAANASPRIPPLTVVFASVARLRRTLDLTTGLMATQQHGRREDGGVRGRHDQRFKASTSRTARNCAPVVNRKRKPAIDSGNLSDEMGTAKNEDEIAWGGVCGKVECGSGLTFCNWVTGH